MPWLCWTTRGLSVTLIHGWKLLQQTGGTRNHGLFSVSLGKYCAAYDNCCVYNWLAVHRYICTLHSSLSEQSHSQTVTGTVTGTVDDSFAATFPSSADTLSQATGGSASEGNADQQESSDSGVEFRDSTSE